MIRSLLTLLLSLLLFSSFAQNGPKRELRGAWIATYANIDWPVRTQTPQQQRTAFLTLIDHHQATGINAVFVQVRSQCDALYPSALEPWSADLTGTQGKAPSPAWDPLQFMIEECHRRGMEFHAWINPYRAAANYSNPSLFAATHVAKQHPEWLLSQGTLRVLNPGLPAVRDYITGVIEDILQRYDVDGIHFDDYFYPPAAPAGTLPYNDDAAYLADPRGFANRGDWRRDNVNLLVQRVYDRVKTLKPWVKFGVSPTGIYRNSTDPAIGSNTRGLEHYTTLYADSRRWLQEGWVDYIAPQVYWYMGQPGADYSLIVPWWNNNAYGRHIYIGMAGYKVADPAQGPNWANPSMIPSEIRLNRHPDHTGIHGQAIYNTTSLRNNRLGFRDSLRFSFYRKPALLPAMPWRDARPPDAPFALKAQPGSGAIQLSWEKPAAAGAMDVARQFVVYRSETPAIDRNDVAHLLAITPTDATAYTDTTVVPGTNYYYIVTALDRFHNESGPSNTSDYTPPAIACPGQQQLGLAAACSAALPDYTALATVTDDLSPAGALTVTQLPAPGTLISGKGTTQVTLTARDAAGNTASFQFTVEAVDGEAPVISGLSADPSTLYPPNHKLRPVHIAYTLSDNCGPVTAVLSVRSNEPDNGTGDGHTEADWEVVDDHRVKLRAERSGSGSGRIYTVTVTATDAAGNTAADTVTITVPHDRGAAVTAAPSGKVSAETAIPSSGLAVQVLPNPGRYQFTVITRSKSEKLLSVRVMDAAGRVVERRTGLAANGRLELGGSYSPGVYYIQVSQGARQQTIRLVKLKD